MKARTLLPFLLFLLGCGDDSPPLGLSPQVVDMGWVDFHTEACMNCECSEGCAQTEVALTNLTEGEVTATMGAFDTDYICVEGYTGSETELGTMNSGSRFLFKISACDYGAGELNLEGQEDPTPAEGSIAFHSDASDESILLTWSFLPFRNQGGVDTAQ